MQALGWVVLLSCALPALIVAMPFILIAASLFNVSGAWDIEDLDLDPEIFDRQPTSRRF